MPAGFQAWDEQGRLIVDLTTRLGRIVGIINIGPADSGTINAPAGFGDFFVIATGAGVTGTGAGYTPVINVSGTSFTYGPNSNFPGGSRSATIIYGFR